MLVVAFNSFSQESYLQYNSIQITHKVSNNEGLMLYQTSSLKSKYNLKKVNFRPIQNHNFITSKVNEYHFAVFEKDIELTKAIGLKVEFQMDKYKNKIALLNVHIPLRI